MYKSPIEIIQGQMRMEQENNILRAVMEQDIHVDKHELLRALQYDRGQYDKGFKDGKADAVVHGRWEEWWPPKHMILTGEDMLYRCSACTAKYADISGLNYCPFCGARMDLPAEVTDEQDFI